MRRALSAVASLSWAAALLACDSFDSGAAAPGLTEAGADGGIASSGDGGSLADSAGGDASTWCSGGHHEICDDFDDGKIGDPTRWPSASNLGALTASSDDPKSAPKALRVSTNANQPAYLARRLARDASRVTCELDLRLDDLPKAGERMDLLRLQLGTGSDFVENYANIVLYADDTKLAWNTHYVNTDIDQGYVSDTLGARPTDATWHHVQITLTAHDFALTVEGVGNGAKEFPAVTTATNLAEVALGAVSGIGGPWSARFDNIACDVVGGGD